MTSRRTQAERDAATIETGYALASAAFLAAVVFAAVAGPAAVWRLPRPVELCLYVAGASGACVLGVARVVHVLRRHARVRRGAP